MSDKQPPDKQPQNPKQQYLDKVLPVRENWRRLVMDKETAKADNIEFINQSIKVAFDLYQKTEREAWTKYADNYPELKRYRINTIKDNENVNEKEENKMVEVPESGVAYLKADEFAVGRTFEAVIIGEGELREQTYNGTTYKQVVIPVKYVGADDVEREVKFSLNATNCVAIKKVLGKETKTWTGHKLNVLVVPNEKAVNKKGLSVIGVI